MSEHVITTIRDLLESDVRAQSLLRELKANPQDLNTWIKVVNTVGRMEKVLSVQTLERHNKAGQYLLFQAVPKQYNNAVFKFLTPGGHSAMPYLFGTTPWVVLKDKVVSFDVIDRPAPGALREADEAERSLERAADPDSVFKMAMQKLRRQRNLGKLRPHQWQALIDGAGLRKYYVYLVSQDSLEPNRIWIYQFTPMKIMPRSFTTNIANILYSDGAYLSAHWLRHYVVASTIGVSKNDRLVMHQTDFSRVSDGETIVRALGIEDVLGD